MKKISSVLLMSLMAIAEPSDAFVRSYWPAYLDTSNCRPGMSCHRDTINVFKDQYKQFFVLDSGTYSQEIINDGWYIESLNANTYVNKLTMHFTLGLYDHNPNGNRGQDGVALLTGRGETTDYSLKAFHSGVTATLHLCEVEIYGNSQQGYRGRCKASGQTKEVSLTWSNDELFRDAEKTYAVERSSNNGLRWGLDYVDLKMNAQSFYLRLTKEPSGRERTLVFPGLKFKAGMSRTTSTGGSYLVKYANGATALYSRMVRLNQRKCYLNADVNDVNFGKITISASDSNRINKADIASKLTLNCDGRYTEHLWSGGQKNWTEPNDSNVNAYTAYTINGTGAIHTVERISITTQGDKVVNVGSEPKIGMGYDNGASDGMLYVEGSFTKGEKCGVNALPINTNLIDRFSFKSFERNADDAKPDSNVPVDGIGPRNVGTIFWRLCKQPGDLKKTGTYRSNATITVEYR